MGHEQIELILGAFGFEVDFNNAELEIQRQDVIMNDSLHASEVIFGDYSFQLPPKSAKASVFTREAEGMQLLLESGNVGGASARVDCQVA